MSRTSTSSEFASKWGLAPFLVLLVVLPVAIYARVASFSSWVRRSGLRLGEPACSRGSASTTSSGRSRPRPSNWHPLTWLSLMLDAEIGGASPARTTSQPRAPRPERAPGVPRLRSHDRTPRPRRPRRGVVRGASAARRVGRLDRRAQGRVEHGVRVARSTPGSRTKDGRPWADGPGDLRGQSDGEADARVVPDPAAAPDVWPLARTAPGAGACSKIPRMLAAASCAVTVLVQAQGGATRSIVQFPLLTRTATRR